MTKRSVWRPNKDEVVAENGAVASERPLISETGVEILRQGGNAVDAAVAMGFCAAVVEPQSTCIAGHGQMLVHMDGRTTALDFSHRAPKLATADMYRILGQSEAGNSIYMVEDNANVIGYQSIGVPGVTAGLCKARDMFGSMPLEQLLEPAIHYAEQGYLPDWNNVLRISDAMTAFMKYGEAANVFLPNGHPPRVGIDKVVQRDLGQTLRLIAKHGKDGFYRGDIPHVIEEDMIKNGGYLRVDDFTDYEVVVGTPASVSYRGYEILGIPAPSGSTTALEIFNILNNFDLPALAHNSPECLHLFIEAARHAFADRYRYLGDPDFSPVPLAGMLSSEYARQIAGTIDRSKALLENERARQPWVAFAENALHDPWPFDLQDKPADLVGASPPQYRRLHHPLRCGGPPAQHGLLHPDSRQQLRLLHYHTWHRSPLPQRHDCLQPQAWRRQFHRRLQARLGQHDAAACNERRQTVPRRGRAGWTPDYLLQRPSGAQRP